MGNDLVATLKAYEAKEREYQQSRRWVEALREAVAKRSPALSGSPDLIEEFLAQMAAVEAARDGANQRCQTVLGAKNYWMERATKAEAALAATKQERENLEGLLDAARDFIVEGGSRYMVGAMDLVKEIDGRLGR